MGVVYATHGVCIFKIIGQIYAMNAWSSSRHSDQYRPLLAWKGDPSTGVGFFHSKTEDNPWLRIQLNRPTTITSVTISNRKDCCGERLQNLEVRAGMKNDLTNDVMGSFKGPGTTGGVHVVRFTKPILAEFMTFQLVKKSATLQINGIRLNQQPAQEDGKLSITMSSPTVS